LSADERAKAQLQKGIDATYLAVRTAEENGLFEQQAVRNVVRLQVIFQLLLNARSNLEVDPPNFSQCSYYLEEAERYYLLAVNSRGREMTVWRTFNLYAVHIWAILIFYLTLVFIVYFYLIHCSAATTLCYISSSALPTLPSVTTNSADIGLGAGNDDVLSNVGIQQQFKNIPAIPQNGVYAVVWGAIGGILQGFWTHWRNIDRKSVV